MQFTVQYVHLIDLIRIIPTHKTVAAHRFAQYTIELLILFMYEADMTVTL